MTDGNNLGSLRDALQESVERLAVIADAIPQLVWVARPDGRIEYYNRRWMEYTGLSVQRTNEAYGTVKGVVHPDDLPGLWERWTSALAKGRTYEAEYRLREAATGVYRWFIARAAPLQDEHGAIVRWIGTCTDIDEQRRARNSLLVATRASDALFASFDLSKGLSDLATLIVSEIADIALVALADGDGSLRPVATAHCDPERSAMLATLRGQRVLTPEGEQMEWRRLQDGRPRVIPRFDLEAGRAQLWPYIASLVAHVRPRSLVTIPLRSRGTTLGGLYVFYDDTARPFDARDVPLLVDVGRRASIAIENARGFERERRIAETFQRAALPTSLVQPPGTRIDAVFLPGSEEVEIGGDWYDVVALRDGGFLIGVGDVMGRGLAAASIMARIRQMIAVAAMYESDPSRLLDTVDQLIRDNFPELVVTAFCGIVDANRTELRYANAGHRPPFLRRSGHVVELRSTGLPLGVRNAVESETKRIALDGAELLVLYTDGLVESRHFDMQGEVRLHEAMEREAVLHTHAPASFIREACVREERSDDVAILAIQFALSNGWSFAAENAQAANDARGDFVRYLRANASDKDAIEAAELVFGELIGNVVRHAQGGIDVELEWRGERPLLHVIDRGPPFGIQADLPSDLLSEGGRGLFIAEHLSERLSIERVGDYGNHVTAELRLERGSKQGE